MTNPNSVTFCLNGKAVTLDNPSPDLLLIDYLRSPEVSLAGAKKGCGQGGCGACTVILSNWDDSKTPEHRSINSCLRPVCSLHGLAVTTIEGTSAAKRPPPTNPKTLINATRGGMPFAAAVNSKVLIDNVSKPKGRKKKSDASINPVAYRLAENNGTQCGYCSTGFVMNMSAFLANNKKPTKKQIEQALDGNICRCTGYRPIMTAMKTFAVDWNAEDEKNRMPCKMDVHAEAQSVDTIVDIPVPPKPKRKLSGVRLEHNDRLWLAPSSIEELCEIYAQYPLEDIYMLNANTSFGVYKEDFLQAKIIVDLGQLSELTHQKIGRKDLILGGATTYTQFLKVVEKIIRNKKLSQTSSLGALQFMAHRTAGTIVRNAATLAGNTMLVLKHIAKGTGEPFPSDLFTVLSALNVRIDYVDLMSGEHNHATAAELTEKIVHAPDLANHILLLKYSIPLGPSEDIVLAQKVALRDINSHSIVNTTSVLKVDQDMTIDHVNLTFGAIEAYPWRARETENFLLGEELSLDLFPQAAEILEAEVKAALKRAAKRSSGLKYEGVSDSYKSDLTRSFLYKAIVNALMQLDETAIPDDIKSSGDITWGNWAVSQGTQDYENQDYKAPVSQPYVKLMALYQTSGQVRYTHEMELPPTAVNAAFVLSQRALAMFEYKNPVTGKTGISAKQLCKQLKRSFPELIKIITYKDLPPDGKNMQGMGGDQPIFSEGMVNYVGQSIALAVAKNETKAAEIAEYISHNCLHYTEVDWPDEWKDPVLGLDDAIARKSIFPDAPSTASFVSHIWQITRPESSFDWLLPPQPYDASIPQDSITTDNCKTMDDCKQAEDYKEIESSEEVETHAKLQECCEEIEDCKKDDDKAAAQNGLMELDKSIRKSCKVIDGVAYEVVKNTQATGGQIHFYMETQSCVALPGEAERLTLHASSQSPTSVHQTAASALKVEHNQIAVNIRQLGGGYGGKTEPAKFVSSAAAIAAKDLNLPVRLVMPRDSDTSMIGKRHPYYGQYQIAIDKGLVNPANKGLIHGIDLGMYGDGGAFYDCSYVVSNCLQLRADNAYKVPNFRSTLDVCRTNTAPNTAMRSFGDIQGKIITENAIDDAAFAVGMCPDKVREKNLYHRGDVTPFGQALTYCYIRDVWSHLKETSNFTARKKEVYDFNKKNKWRKRGIYILPVKYGNGYNLVQLEQASAMVSVYSGDGSIIINQGGVDMGQGAITKVEQIASYILNVPMDMIQVQSAKTDVIPNPTSTGGSTGTAYNGLAVKMTCERLRSRLMDFGYQILKENGDAWCTEHGIDFWNHGTQGWAACSGSGDGIIWQNLVTLAYQKRISLVESFNAKVPGGTDPVPNITFKDKSAQKAIPGIKLAELKPDQEISGEVDSFSGWTYSAACAEVEVDILTGETKIIRADVMYDMGWSLNPALDIGQVEGAFMQGVGYVTTEQLVFEPEGENKGRLNTVNTWRYKPPATTNIPLQFNVSLFPRDNASEVPENPNELMSAKEVGEPPLVLGASVFFAIKAAVRASRIERGLSGLFKMDAPATVQEISKACDVTFNP